MNFTKQDVEQLRVILGVCRIGNIESFVLTDGKVRGSNDKRNMAIISDADLSLDKELKMGVGRLSDLDKRLSMFTEVDIEYKTNSRGEVAQLTMQSGRSKAQFRCTSEAMIKYPKSNDDAALVVVTMSKAEVAQLSKATKTYGSETVLVKVGREGSVHIECADSTNDQFSIDLEKAAEFIDESEPAVFTYVASNYCTIIDAVVKDADSVDLVIGQMGSITVLVKGHTLMIMPIVNEDE